MTGEEKLRDYLKRATVELAGARRRLAEYEARESEPIAVIGMSCRFPGAPDVEAYWRLLREGRAAEVGDVPAGRFDHLPDTGGTRRRGAFLSEVDGWDAGFFGYAPQEALRMDPQQRLLMELAWEAMDDAGTPAPRLAGSRTGVLLGFSDAFQYGQVEAEREGTGVYADPYMGQGSLASVVAGRLAYHFDLRGPAFSLDTACSSTLVAVHLAARALRAGECDYALAGGGFLALHPFLYVYSSRNALLSPTDRCHTFDTSADGYMMGEGGGMVVLARLSDAVRDGHRIRAVIRGSAVNQDGRSNGLTAPNRSAQVEVIRRALADAGAAPGDVDFLEAHGSGTPLGDEIELGALGDVFGGRPAGRPLTVGAVKTNIGHTHTAAGIAGLIKTVLVLENGEIPANLHLSDPAEQVLANEAVRPSTGPASLPDHGRPAVAGVSSFGWSGTNAHLVLEAAPPAEPRPEAVKPTAELIPVSAASEAALRAQLTRLAQITTPTTRVTPPITRDTAPITRDTAPVTRDTPPITRVDRPITGVDLPITPTDSPGTRADLPGTRTDRPSTPTDSASTPTDRPDTPATPAANLTLADLAHTLREGRAPLDHRRAVVATSLEDAVRQLTSAAQSPGVHRKPGTPKIAFLLPGVGDQYRGLATQLYRDEPVFAQAVDECCAIAAERCEVDLRAAFFAEPRAIEASFFGAGQADELLDRAEVAHPLLFTVEYALARLLADRGVRPDLLVGYSLGEYVAACLAGVFTLGDALHVVTGRARLIGRAPAGRMLAVAASASRIAEALSPMRVDVAALNGPQMTVLSGSPADVEAAAAQLKEAGLAARVLRSAHPFHSTLLEPARAELAELVASVPRQAPRIPLVSNATGTALTDAEAIDPQYWAGHLCRPVRFADGVHHCAGEDVDVYVELGPGQTLGGLVRQNQAGARPAVLGTLPAPWPVEDRPAEGTALLDTLARLWELGVAVDFTALRGDGRTVSLPGYPFQRTKFWPQATRKAPEPVEDAGRLYAPVWRLDPTRPTTTPQGSLITTNGELATLAARAGMTVGTDPATLPQPLHVVHDGGFDDLLRTVQALDGHDVRLLTVTTGAAEITGGDLTAPDAALVHGLGRGVRAEYPGLRWRGVDVEPGTPATHLLDELARPWPDDPAAEPVLAGRRGGRRRLQEYTEITLDEATPDWGGTHVITGGTRGLGLIVAKHLVRRGARKLALISRTGEADQAGLAELSDAEVLLIKADAGVPEQLRAALAEARTRFGELDSIVHAAGLPGGGLAQRRTAEDMHRTLAPKVQAIGPLLEARPRRLVLFSSIVTVVGGIGEADYCAANSVLDAHGAALSTADTQVVTVAWGHWQHDAWADAATGEARLAYRRRYGFTAEAGCALLDKLVGNGVRGTVVALRQDLPAARRELAALNDLGGLLEAAPAPVTRYPRPPLRTEYAAPRGELETDIAGVWGEFLGIDAVGVHDPFFDLGGNSLVGMAMVAALEKRLGRRIAPAVLFGHPTVAAFAAALTDTDSPAPRAATTGSARGQRRRLAGTRK
ncbi:type I polyketide synthase [Amycolatopsis sp. DG1A-15b]|uniref:type I polyketide synthase n=1 Tax=Amycolatopsis sp. DG1A-15b TaxID=3052846 RepID=UPI00255B7ED1|nr:type I polyketide synthase [Amycolatopsis sp. DG1A-15b]WIX90553.1 SDR family NAD(P)-dependent oxidoreductase [Amycolatopsis sp. DG1A-15b]